MRDRVLRHRARAMRTAPTKAELVMWRLLGRDQFGVRFRRQHPIGPFIADFYWPALKLVVEVDGGQHNSSDYDARRDAWFKARGYRVLRFWNLDVLTNSDGVGEQVCRTIEALRA